MKKIWTVVFAALFIFTLLAPVAIADDYDFAYKKLGELDSLSETASSDKLLVYDDSAQKGKTMDANAPVFGGDVTFRSSLLAAGRKNGDSTVSSSSTNLAPSTLPFTVIRKAVGAASGLDSNDGGTRLPNGTPGQVLVLLMVSREGAGTWIVTPVTKFGFVTLTFDAVGEMATLLYVDDTVGWIVLGYTGTTVALSVDIGLG